MNRFRLLALIVVAASSIACGDSATAPSTVERLVGDWSLVAFENSDGTVETIEDVGAYTAAFTPEGRVGLLADCNRCSGSFATSGLELNVGALACTLAFCPPGSKSDAFIRAMDGASSYLRHESQLFVYHPGGRLRLERN